MTSITITLPDERMQELQELATRLGLSVEALIRASIAELRSRPEEDFQHAAEYVLRKNAGLYKRLA